MYNYNYGLKDKIDNLMMLIEYMVQKKNKFLIGQVKELKNAKPKLGLPPNVMEGRKKNVVDVHLP
jgi:hypothetical protein